MTTAEEKNEKEKGKEITRDRDSSKRELLDFNSLDALLTGTITKGWKTNDLQEMDDTVSPDTLISEHPEYVLREGKTIHYFECPDCGFMIEITTTKRPLEVGCSSCGSRYRLKGPKREKKEENEVVEEKEPWDEKSRLGELAMKYHDRGELDRALEMYDRILKISKNDPVVWNNKGVAFDSLGLHISAIKCYENAIELRKGYTDAWFNLAYSQYRMRQYEKATESLRTLLRQKPNHEEGNILLDKCEEKLKEWKNLMD